MRPLSLASDRGDRQHAGQDRPGSAADAVHALGLLLSVVVHAADVQDRDSAAAVLRQARRSFPFIERIYADGGYQGPIMAKTVAKTGPWRLETSNAAISIALSFCPSAGSSNGPSLGSATAVDWPRTSSV